MLKIDRETVIQILGSLMNKPSLLTETDRYYFDITDFPQMLDRYIYSAICNLYNEGDGANNIRSVDIINYLQNHPSAKILLEKENGEIFIQDCESLGEPLNFNHYYNRFKKINFLRDLQKEGKPIDKYYCEDILNPNYNKINENFEHLTVADILNDMKLEFSKYESKYVLKNQYEESKASEGIRELIVQLKETPEIGCKLQGDIINTITRGGRKGKMYLRSAGSGVGKTRSMVGDACNIAYPIRYDRVKGKWIETGSCEKVLYIMTEQDTEEIKTMILAYLTGFNEEIFLYGNFGEEEMGRINKAIEIMERFEDNMLFARIPDPSASIIKNLFRTYNIQFGVENFFYDYIFSSPAMLEEYRDLGLREDVCLRLLTTAIKNLSVELSSFVMTSTQVSNDDDKAGGFKDFRNIRGSKAIVDLADFAAIMSRPTVEELKQIAGFSKSFNFTPNLVTDIFKNRRGRWNMVRVWSLNDLGCCRRDDLFITTADNKPIENFQVVEFMSDVIGQFDDLLEKYNKDESGCGEMIQFDSYYTDPSDTLEETYEKAAEAFRDEKECHKRYKDRSFDEFL